LAYKMPTWVANDVSFEASAAPALETRQLRSGHMIVHPTVNGKDIGWFILDSGAEAMCIDKGGADELGLMSVGKVPAVGVGGVVQVPFRLAREMKLGPGTYRNLAMLELDLAQISKLLGLKLGGIVGYDVFRRSVVEMDVQKPEVRLHNPASYKLPSGRWQAIRFDGGNIGVEAKFEGSRSGWFRLDTGAGGTITFHTPFVDRYKMLEGREVSKTMQGGVGGMIEAREGSIDYFELGGFRFDKPAATFSLTKHGAMANKWLVGNIGQDFMKPFVMVFDYQRSRLAFVKK
jgi:hypothetical protein